MVAVVFSLGYTCLEKPSWRDGVLFWDCISQEGYKLPCIFNNDALISWATRMDSVACCWEPYLICGQREAGIKATETLLTGYSALCMLSQDIGNFKFLILKCASNLFSFIVFVFFWPFDWKCFSSIESSLTFPFIYPLNGNLWNVK